MQEILVVLVVLAASFYLAIKLYKSIFSAKKGCDVSCGCESSSTSTLLNQLKNRG